MADDVNTPRLARNVGRHARVTVWWPGAGEQRAKVGSVTVLQVMDGPDVEAARAAIDRFGCADLGLRPSDPLWLEDRHSGQEARFKVLAERGDKALLLVWVERDPRNPSRVNVVSAFASEGKTLAPLCAVRPG